VFDRGGASVHRCAPQDCLPVLEVRPDEAEHEAEPLKAGSPDRVVAAVHHVARRGGGRFPETRADDLWGEGELVLGQRRGERYVSTAGLATGVSVEQFVE
jgi:hypothetical protein